MRYVWRHRVDIQIDWCRALRLTDAIWNSREISPAKRENSFIGSRTKWRNVWWVGARIIVFSLIWRG